MDADPIQTEKTKRRHYFIFKREGIAFTRSMTQLLADSHGAMVAQHISHDNIESYSHGAGSYHPAAPELGETKLQQSSAVMETKFEDIVAQNLSILPNTLTKLLQTMERNFFSMLYSTVNESCEASGNSVSAKEAGSNAKAFLEMLKKIEFGVDRDGQVSLPSLHVSPEMGDKMMRELQAQPEEFKQEVEAVKKAKAEAALEKELARKRRFKGWQE